MSDLNAALLGLALGFGLSGFGLYWQRRRDVRLLRRVRLEHPGTHPFAVSVTIALRAAFASSLPNKRIIGRLVFLVEANGLFLATRHSPRPQLLIPWASIEAARFGSGAVFGKPARALVLEQNGADGNRVIVLPPMTDRTGIFVALSPTDFQNLLTAVEGSIEVGVG